MSRDSHTHDVLIEVWNKPDPYFTFGKRFRMTPPGRFSPWRVEPDNRKKPTHTLASTSKSLIAVFPSAIAIGSPVATGKSVAGWGGMLTSGLFTVMFGHTFSSSAMEYTPSYFVIILSFVATLFFTLCFIWSFRRLFRAVSDWPIIFNRKTRQITYLPAFIMPFLQFWKSPPIEWCAVGWDEVKARTYKHLETNAGKSFHYSFHLFLLWGGEAGDAHALRGYVSIGREGYFEDETLWMLWEHIRRYMEEDGPAIPPGEELRPKTLGRPVIYPPEVIKAAGGPPLDAESVARLAEEAVEQ